MSADVQNASKEHPAARALAEWWAEQFGAPVHKIVPDDATGRDKEAGDFAFLVMQTAAARHPMASGAGEKFVEALTPVVSGWLDRTNWVSLGVDYGADPALGDAADKAGIDSSRFPWKTNSWATKDYVTVSLGYRGATRLIWQAPDWVRPACESIGYDEATELFADELCGLPKFHDGEHGDWKPDTNLCTRCGATQAKHWNDRGQWDHTFKREGEAE